MEFDGSLSLLSTPLKVFFIDLLLSGDNAVLIALACRSLAPDIMRRAVLYGTGAAIVLRCILAIMVGSLLLVPWLKLVGAVALVVIAIQLIVGDDDEPQDEDGGGDGLWAAIRTIVIADVVMSLDNVVAVAAVAQGSVGYLVLGLALSIPLLVYGSLLVGRMLESNPILITAGGALLGWIAGDLAVSDPAISGWIDSRAFALRVAVPVVTTVFVVVHSRILAEQRKNGIKYPWPSPLAVVGHTIANFIIGQFVAPQDSKPEGPIAVNPAPISVPKIPVPAVSRPEPVNQEPVNQELAGPEQTGPEQTGGSKFMVIIFLIITPLLFMALVAYSVWSSTLSDG